MGEVKNISCAQAQADAVEAWLEAGVRGPSCKGSHQSLMGYHPRQGHDRFGSREGERDGFVYPSGLALYASGFKVVPPGLYEYLVDKGILPKPKRKPKRKPKPANPFMAWCAAVDADR